MQKKTPLSQLALLIFICANANMSSIAFGATGTLAASTKSPISVKQYGAVGDGKNDDTNAIQYALDSSESALYFSDGNYKITRPLTLSSPDKIISSAKDGVLIADTKNITVITVTGDRVEININIDGNSKAAQGIEFKKTLHPIIRNSRVVNLYGDPVGASGIRLTDCTGGIIDGNTISDIGSQPNGVLGDSPGSARAIVISSKNDNFDPIAVTNNKISNIYAEEGDAVQLLFFSGRLPFLKANASITNNNIAGFNRRAIKIQASNVMIANNKITDSPVESQDYNPESAINIISSSNIETSNNSIELSGSLIGIASQGKANAPNENVTIRDNIIRLGNEKPAIYLEHSQHILIDKNTITGGSNAISLSHCHEILIANNHLLGGHGVENSGINITQSCSNVLAKSNTAMGSKRGYMIRDTSTNSSIIGNRNMTPSGRDIYSAAPSRDNLYIGNTRNEAPATIDRR